MKSIKFGAGFTVFIIFFGISLLEAFKNQSWLLVLFWLVMGLIFLLADNTTDSRETE